VEFEIVSLQEYFFKAVNSRMKMLRRHENGKAVIEITSLYFQCMRIKSNIAVGVVHRPQSTYTYNTLMYGGLRS